MKHSNKRKPKNITKLVAVSTFLLVAVTTFVYFQTQSQAKDQDRMLTKYGFAGMEMMDVVSALDHTIDEPASLSAGITGAEFIMMDNNKKYQFDVPEDKFYLSFAPYVYDIHPCDNHNLITCRGELVEKDIVVVIKDDQGNAIIDETMTTMENGFIGIWLPSNQILTLNLSYNGKHVEQDFSTHKTANTCLTTPLQLS